MDKLKAVLHRAEEAYGRWVEEVGNEALARYVMPFCDKHELFFDSGMGCYGFFNSRDEEISSDWTHRLMLGSFAGPPDPDDPAGWDEVCQVLHMQTILGELFNHIESYDARNCE